MKLNLILAAAIAIVSYATCKNFQKTAAPAASTGIVIENTANNSASEIPPPSVRPPKLVEVPVDAVPPANASRKAYLSGGWWNFNAAVGEEMLIAEYRAKWLKFRENQTFDILINNKTVGTGRWNWDEAAMQLYLACSDPFVNGVWGIKTSGYTMVWMGNSAYTNHGYQVRLSNSKAEPPSN